MPVFPNMSSPRVQDSEKLSSAQSSRMFAFALFINARVSVISSPEYEIVRNCRVIKVGKLVLQFLT